MPSATVNKCSGSCNDINRTYTKLCVPDVVEDMIIKVFKLLSRTNETRYMSQYDTCVCKYRLVACVCNDRQRSNKDKCKCECKELMDKGRCNEEFKRNPRTCECECEKSCDVGEYLNYMACKCRKRQIDQLFDNCDEDTDENETAQDATFYDFGLNKKKHKSRMPYVILFS